MWIYGLYLKKKKRWAMNLHIAIKMHWWKSQNITFFTKIKLLKEIKHYSVSKYQHRTNCSTDLKSLIYKCDLLTFNTLVLCWNKALFLYLFVLVVNFSLSCNGQLITWECFIEFLTVLQMFMSGLTLRFKISNRGASGWYVLSSSEKIFKSGTNSVQRWVLKCIYATFLLAKTKS